MDSMFLVNRTSSVPKSVVLYELDKDISIRRKTPCACTTRSNPIVEPIKFGTDLQIIFLTPYTGVC